MESNKDLKKDKIKKATYIILAVTILTAIFAVIKCIKYLKPLPVILGVTIVALLVAVTLFVGRKKEKPALVISIILLVLTMVMCVGVYLLDSKISDIGKTVEYETVEIVALKDSGITAEDKFDSYVMGHANDDMDAYERGSEILIENSKVVKKSKPHSSTDELWKNINNGTIDLMVLTSITRSDLTTIDEDYRDKIVVLFEKKYEIEKGESKDVDITKEPFVLYLCGADLSAGDDITSTGRGDVNILLTINPNTEQVYMQVIPRDTFVNVTCRGGRSKLSYSGWWGGVQSSIKSIEDKFGIDINYYAKINFNGLTDLVDALGGVTVYSHYSYSSGEYTFHEGYNKVDGDKALMFARARKMLPGNELGRGLHQMELIKGIFKKFGEEPTYDHALAVLDSITDNFVTNVPSQKYYDAFSLVVKLLPKLQEMEIHTMTGTFEWHDDEVRTNYYLYYFYPAEGEVERVRGNIEKILNGESADTLE